MSEPIYCGLAFGSMSMGLKGELRPCCGIVPEHFPDNSVLGNDHITQKVNHEKLRELRRDLINGVWHPACYSCRDNEARGSYSMRMIWNKTIDNAPMTEFMNPNDVKFLDLSVGNKCNSKCMTCGPGVSDFWIEEYAHINNTIPIFQQSVVLTDDLVNELVDSFRNVEYINFIGGEPLMLDEHTQFLKFLVDKGLSKQITIGYVTNLTMISESLIELWGSFKNVGASISIDGHGKVNEYIRYPIKFAKVEQNLKRYMDLISENKFGMNLSATISIFNINEFADLLEFFLDMYIKQKETVGIDSHKVAVFCNRVTIPKYYNLNILSTEYRSKGLEKIKKLKEKINSLDIEIDRSFIESCTLVESWCREPQVELTDLPSIALYQIDKSDEYRNRSIKDYLPELYEELTRLDKQHNGS